MFRGKTRSYFLFSKKERWGVITLVIAMVILFFTPELLELFNKEPDREKIKKFNAEISKWVSENQMDSSGNFFEDGEDSSSHEKIAHSKANHAEVRKSLFYFDPNKISFLDWRKLGLKDRTIQTIQHYLQRGGRFKKPEDLRKIYGLEEEEYRNLSPFVRIPEHEQSFMNSGQNLSTGRNVVRPKSTSFEGQEKKYSLPININLADTAAFISLPGIGSKLANRIVNYREKLGGFISVDQLAETYGLDDSVFRKIRPRLMIGSESVRRVYINGASIEELKSHPYIRWNLARAIIEYRNQHGPFHHLDELLQLNIISQANYQRILPYLKLDSL